MASSSRLRNDSHKERVNNIEKKIETKKKHNIRNLNQNEDTSENHRLAKELNSLRVQYRVKAKNASHLTLENVRIKISNSNLFYKNLNVLLLF